MSQGLRVSAIPGETSKRVRAAPQGHLSLSAWPYWMLRTEETFQENNILIKENDG